MRRLMAVVLIAGCAGSQALSAAGARVRVATGTPPPDCEYVRSVTAERGGNFQSYDENVESAVNELRNEAGAAGATHVTFETPRPDRAGGCRNCVSVSGVAFRCQ